MKILQLLIFLAITANVAFSQLNTGDIAFVGWNADGDDDIAFVTFVEIPANTKIYFCDSELDGNGAFVSGEGDITWNAPANAVPAGTIVTISGLSATPNTNIGTLSDINSGGLSTSDEAMFAFLGSAPRTATTFLAAIGNNSPTCFGNLTNSGLSIGSSAIALPTGNDIAQYIGARTGANQAGYISFLNNMANWETQDTGNDDHNDGTDPDVPFDVTEFTISLTDNIAPGIANFSVINRNAIKVIFTEEVTQNSANLLSNYSITNSTTITNIYYDNNTSATITHSGFANGTAYVLSLNNLIDLASNTMTTPFVSPNLYFNDTKAKLAITEIMYNPPTSGADSLEFIEIFNLDNVDVELGGLRVTDGGNINFYFENISLDQNTSVLLATDKVTAESFYGEDFIDMINGVSNALGNGGETLSIINSNNETLFTVTYDDAAPWPTTPDGGGHSLELRNPNLTINDGENWNAATNFSGTFNGANVYASPGSFEIVIEPNITFASSNVKVNENDPFAVITYKLSNATPESVSFDINLIPNGTAMENTNFRYPVNRTINVAPNKTQDTIRIPLIDNTTATNDKYFTLEIANPSDNALLGSQVLLPVYIIDNEIQNITGTDDLGISHLASYVVDADGSAEIVYHDPSSQRLFVMNSTRSRVEILDFRNPKAITKIKTIDLSEYGIGGTSIAVGNGIVAATIEGANFGPGKVVFFDINGENEKVVNVGVLPDMVTFTPDGNYCLTANEGQPSSNYETDPEGSVSIIEIKGGLSKIDQSAVKTANFQSFNNKLNELKLAGVRIFGQTLNNVKSTVAEDVEPEFITVADDSKTAWVSLQENNAIAEVDIINVQIRQIIPMGYKDHLIARNSMDASDNSGFIFMSNWPVKGMYMPDAIANYEINGKRYIVTANEGDAREYGDFEEEERVGAVDYVLDPVKFPNANVLKLNSNLGRLTVTNKTGDTDGDGDFDEIHVLGGRSFSIMDAETGLIVYDSGNEFELITANDPTYKTLFNASNDNNNLKNRSDNKGPEPEGITVAKIKDKVYAFITLERTGGMMTYDITNPAAAKFVKYINTRILANVGGDLGPEGIIYIAPENSPNDTAMVVMANEVSASLSVFKLSNVFTLPSPPKVSFVESNQVVNEEAGKANVKVQLSKPTVFEVKFRVEVAPFGTAVNGIDFDFENTEFTVPSNQTEINFNVNLLKNTSSLQDKYFILRITNIIRGEEGSTTNYVVYLRNNDIPVPPTTNELNIEFASSYVVDPDGSAEIVAYDSASKRLFVMNSTATKIEILNFENPRNIQKVKSVDLTTLGIGGQSVAVRNGLLAAAIDSDNFANGKIAFMDINGENVKTVEVGVLPDNISFSPDGKYLVTANEGQPNDDYTTDPEGSISIIDVTGGLAAINQSKVVTANFNTFDGKETLLRNTGIRIFGPNANTSKDMEPEYVTFSTDSKRAYVTLQENNAVAVVNLETKTIINILPLGKKNHNIAENAFDASDRFSGIFMSSWPVFGLYMPDAIATYNVDGTDYLVTANEGDSRDYDGYSEESSVGDSDYILDPVKFPNASFLKNNLNIGRLGVTTATGDTDGDGDFDEIHVLGGRSFSIWNSTTGSLVYDSKNDFEVITANDPNFKSLFNASNENNNFKNRSENKGPEPEGITVAKIKDNHYAFITLERIGGMMVYNVTNPNAPKFVKYVNSRSVDTFGGDLGPEGIIYISAEASPNDTAMVVMANEVSSSLSVFVIKNVVDVTSVNDEQITNSFKVFPNPSNDFVYFSSPINFELVDNTGKVVAKGNNAPLVDVRNLISGTYYLNFDGKTEIITIVK